MLVNVHMYTGFGMSAEKLYFANRILLLFIFYFKIIWDKKKMFLWSMINQFAIMHTIIPAVGSVGISFVTFKLNVSIKIQQQ